MNPILLILAAGVCARGADGRLPETYAPQWDRKPTAEEIMWAFPKAAAEQEISGVVRMRCGVTKTGLPEICEVLEESPKDSGFGEAALEMSKLMTFLPAKDCGQLIESSVVMPVIFRFDDYAATAQPEPITPEKVALAKRILLQRLEPMKAYYRGQMPATGSSDPAERRRAFKAFDEAFAAVQDEMITVRAEALAASLTEAQLTQAVRYFESDTARALEQAYPDASARKKTDDLDARLWQVFRSTLAKTDNGRP